MPVSIKIKNSQIITDVFLKRVIESIDRDTSNDFSVKLRFDSSRDSSKLLILQHEMKEIKIVRHGENDDEIRIKGEKESVIELMKLILTHAALVVSEELCEGLFLDETLVRFRALLKENLKNSIENAFESCQDHE